MRPPEQGLTMPREPSKVHSNSGEVCMFFISSGACAQLLQSYFLSMCATLLVCSEQASFP